MAASASERQLCVSVDVDGLYLYGQIHGIDSVSGDDPIWSVAVPRWLSLFDALGIPGTFFLVGQDLENPAAARLAQQMTRGGHEVGNHTWSHRYDLTRLGAKEMASEVTSGLQAIACATGAPVPGFRAPGYTVNETLLAAVSAAGHSYDSSVFPAVPYYAAKAALLFFQRITGRRSAAILDHPRVLCAPLSPYRASVSRYHRRGEGIAELPIAVVPGLRVPFIGTAIVLANDLLARALTYVMAHQPFINLECHALDLLDASDPGVPAALPARQPDLRVPAKIKYERLAGAIARLLRTHRASCLEEVSALA